MQVFDHISARDAQFIDRQKLFFVATAPLAADGHVNLSPKGLDTFRVLGEKTVAYLDFTGSGVETIAHLRENARIVILFCAFEGPPNILRLHGRGEVALPGTDAFERLRPRLPRHDGVRGIITVHVERVSTSCGYGVPLYAFQGERDQLPKWVERKGPDGVQQYQLTKNARSIDGLPGLG